LFFIFGSALSVFGGFLVQRSKTNQRPVVIGPPSRDSDWLNDKLVIVHAAASGRASTTSIVPHRRSSGTENGNSANERGATHQNQLRRTRNVELTTKNATTIVDAALDKLTLQR
jgi:hypothetical protein